MERWTKVGLLFAPQGEHPWMASHAALPVVHDLGASRARMYVSTRDAQNRASIASLDFSYSGALQIEAIASRPVLEFGALGAFDDSGVTSSCLIEHGDWRHLYYTGWSRGITVPFYFYVGLARAPRGSERFERVSAAPILERSATDPYLTASPSVLIENGTWCMWYISCSGWDRLADGGVRHRYHIRYAESRDGIDWKRDGRVCLDYGSNGEYAFARPFVIAENAGYRMWFSHRGDAYRLGYAESKDGLIWERHGEPSGLGPSPAGWDSEMIAYAAIADLGEERYCFYNGNGYGATGVGYAIAETTTRP